MEESRNIDFNVEDFAPKKGEKFFYTLMVLTFFVVVALIIYITVVTVTPYEPYEWYSYTPSEEVVCPGAPVQVYVDRYIDPDADVDSVLINGYWTNADNGTRVGDVSAYVNTENEGPQAVSSAFKSAPNEEGEWYPTGYLIVEGELYGWSVTQSEEYMGDRPITVEDGKDC